MFLKAVYVNGWTIQKRKKIKTMPEFIDLVKKYDRVKSKHDFESDEIVENYLDTIV